MTEEERAALWRQQQVARSQSEAARLALLRGNETTAAALRAKFEPLQGVPGPRPARRRWRWR